MKKANQYKSIQQHHVLSLLYLVFVLLLFGQQTPYQSLVQEPVQEGIKQASVDYFHTVALSSTNIEFDQTKFPHPFGSSGFSLSSSSSFTTVPFPQAVYKQAYETAVSKFITVKPLLMQRWKIERFSHQTNVPFIV